MDRNKHKIVVLGAAAQLIKPKDIIIIFRLLHLSINYDKQVQKKHSQLSDNPWIFTSGF